MSAGYNIIPSYRGGTPSGHITATYNGTGSWTFAAAGFSGEYVAIYQQFSSGFTFTLNYIVNTSGGGSLFYYNGSSVPDTSSHDCLEL